MTGRCAQAAPERQAFLPFVFGRLRVLRPVTVSTMRRCHYSQCDAGASYKFEGDSKSPAYCRQHALDGMVDVHNKRCAHDSCRKHPNFNVEGSKRPAYCKQHAGNAMVNVRKRRCSRGSCKKIPNFNFVGRKVPVYCKQHAEDGMVLSLIHI